MKRERTYKGSVDTLGAEPVKAVHDDSTVFDDIQADNAEDVVPQRAPVYERKERERERERRE